MATIIFDFDDTLFDNTRFKKDIFDILKSFEVKEADIVDAYLSVRNAYDYQRHIGKIKEIYPETNHGEILTKLNALSLDQYLFPKVKNILEDLNENHTLLLLSFGSEDFQNKKIKDSGIHQYFKPEHIHITQNKKVEKIKNLKIEYPVYFINDKETENESIKKEFPEFTFFLVSVENPVSKIIRQI